MKIKHIFTSLLLAGSMMMSGVAFTSCDNDDLSTEQFTKEISLNVYGPSPVTRGGQLRFIGSGLDKVTSITIPGCSQDVTEIEVISSNEIRIIVPQDAKPGLLVLHHATGDITTLTALNFLEPIVLDEITPGSIKPGNDVTLKGDYLNLIRRVIFSDGVAVDSLDFKKWTRHEIVLTVPFEAQSGKIILSDYIDDEIIPNEIYSEDELTVTLPSVDKVLDLTGKKPGDKVTAAGKDLDLVVAVVMPNGEEVEFTVNNESTAIEFTLSGSVSNGTVRMIPASGVEVPVATIGVAVPENVVAEPAKDIWAGDVITFKGLNMELVTSVAFPNVDAAVEPASKSATEITVSVPEGTRGGDVILNTASGETVSVGITTLKPENVTFNPSSVGLAATLNISGKNLQIVSEVIFAGSTAVGVSSADATAISVSVPATLGSGAVGVSLGLSNGEIVEAGQITITSPECAFLPNPPGEGSEIKPGDLLTLDVVNGDKLTGVKVNGMPAQYILSGDKLLVSLPENAGKETELTLVSSNGEISYTIILAVAQTIWEGSWVNGGWEGNQDLAWGGFDWTTVKAGQTLRVYCNSVVAEGEWWCVSLRHGNGWANLPDPCPAQYDNPENGIVELVLTDVILQDLIDNGGLVVSGSNFEMVKITIE